MRLEPDWWSRARTLKAQGFSMTEICQSVGKSRSAVLYCLNDKVRAGAKKKSSRIWAQYAASGGTDAGRIYDQERQKMRRIAREECVARGNCTPDALRRTYRQFECL